MSGRNFTYKNEQQLRKDADILNLSIPYAESTAAITTPLALGRTTLPNRMAVQPVEGFDAEDDGSPSKLTYRRYRRFGAGGAGLIWVEATAVSRMGRGHDHLLYLHKGNVGKFRELRDQIRKASEQSSTQQSPYTVLQLHYSGRFGQYHEILFHQAELDAFNGVKETQKPLSDQRLRKIRDEFIETAILAESAGFDAVDVKCCHGYLLGELLAAHERPGPYGGDLEGRTRLQKEIIEGIQQQTGLDIAVRMDIYNSYRYPYNWGCDADGNPDMTEPAAFAKELAAMGVKLIGVSSGIPYVKTYLSRPYNKVGVCEEHPLVSIDRLIRLTGELQEELGGTPVVGTAYSSLRELAANIGAAVIESGKASLIGFARGALAYPDFANDIIETGKMDRRKVCLSCDGCIKLLDSGRAAGCVIRDDAYHL